MYHLSQWWLIISKIHWHSPDGNFTRHISHQSLEVTWDLVIHNFIPISQANELADHCKSYSLVKSLFTKCPTGLYMYHYENDYIPSLKVSVWLWYWYVVQSRSGLGNTYKFEYVSNLKDNVLHWCTYHEYLLSVGREHCSGGTSLDLSIGGILEIILGFWNGNN